MPASAHTSATRRQHGKHSSSSWHQLPWDVVIPATLFAAAAASYQDPSKAPAILFFLLGCALVCIAPVTSYFCQPATRGAVVLLTESLHTLSNKSQQHDDVTDDLLEAMAQCISRFCLLQESNNNSALTKTLKAVVIHTLTDDELQAAMIDTLQSALVKASENQGLQTTMLDITKRAFLEALNDDGFVKDFMTGIVQAVVTASQQEQLTQSMLDVVRQAVSQALKDEQFTTEMKGALKAYLGDGELYRAGAQGMISAAFGGNKKKEFV